MTEEDILLYHIIKEMLLISKNQELYRLTVDTLYQNMFIGCQNIFLNILMLNLTIYFL